MSKYVDLAGPDQTASSGLVYSDSTNICLSEYLRVIWYISMLHCATDVQKTSHPGLLAIMIRLIHLLSNDTTFHLNGTFDAL